MLRLGLRCVVSEEVLDVLDIECACHRPPELFDDVVDSVVFDLQDFAWSDPRQLQLPICALLQALFVDTDQLSLLELDRLG